MAGSTALSLYSSGQQAKHAAEAARSRALANAQTARNIRTEAQGRKLLNLEAHVQADYAIAGASGARGVQVDSVSNLAMMRRNNTRRLLDDMSIQATAESRIANLWADTGAAYRKAQMVKQKAGIDALKSIANFGAAAHGAMTSSPAAGAGQSVTVSQVDSSPGTTVAPMTIFDGD